MPSDFRQIRRNEWVTVIILFFINLINYMDRFTVAGMLPEIKNDFKIGYDKSGLLQTAFIVSYMLFAPLFGYLGDRHNRKILMSIGIFLWSLTTFIGSFMASYEWFLIFRAMVGIGEASYSTIAPTLISDLFIRNVRSKMLALFYFAIPIGSGMGYIIGGEMSKATGSWKWGLRVTPALGIIAIILLICGVREPIRGEREGGIHITNTGWLQDIRALIKNRSFTLSTAGFTCVSFVAGALSWWAPTYLQLGFKLIGSDVNTLDVDYKFGLIAMVSGLIGVPLGSFLAQKFRVYWSSTDPLICGAGLLISAPLIFFSIITADTNTTVCFILIFLGQVALNLNWAIVADILLYVVIPTRRSSAEAFQISLAHAFGDAGSPYLIGLLSEALKFVVLPSLSLGGSTISVYSDIVEFRSLQYALFVTVFVQILGALFFFFSALYIEKDKALVELAITGGSVSDSVHIYNDETESESQDDTFGT
ncbi:protein spinster-like isoform X1 [Vespa mandarinia]|uniref:protein spinster-like isoform X1 n=2 Tax=Vespa mandarinia TaxID=7446 RepID=UPI00161DFD73|nr:protein spinster-like isoform X1 [Vespa mandarinia]